MHLLFNDRSVAHQAANPYVADGLLLELADLLRALEHRMVNNDDESVETLDAIYKHRNSRTQEICAGLTVEGWFFDARHSDDASRRRQIATAKQYLIQKLIANPYIETVLQGFDHICEQYQEGVRHDVTGTIIAGAAYLQGILFSVSGCIEYPPGMLAINYWPAGEEGPRDTEIEHYTAAQELAAQRRKYEAHGKHDPSMPTYGVRGAEMRLSIEEAEEVLNTGVQIGRRVFGHTPDGKIYVFPSHRPNFYHGYPVEVSELQKRAGFIYSRLRERGWIR